MMADKKEYIERGALIAEIKNTFDTHYLGETYSDCFDRVYYLMESLRNAPAADVVSRGVFEQVKWERDMAMQQLEEHGIPFGGKAEDVIEVVRCKDCKHWGGETFGYICKEWSGMTFRNYTKPDHYCSRGERKEQNNGD